VTEGVAGSAGSVTPDSGDKADPRYRSRDELVRRNLHGVVGFILHRVTAFAHYGCVVLAKVCSEVVWVSESFFALWAGELLFVEVNG
jgi:hypothetical protein